jgi:hypothetical protein
LTAWTWAPIWWRVCGSARSSCRLVCACPLFCGQYLLLALHRVSALAADVCWFVFTHFCTGSIVDCLAPYMRADADSVPRQGQGARNMYSLTGVINHRGGMGGMHQSCARARSPASAFIPCLICEQPVPSREQRMAFVCVKTAAPSACRRALCSVRPKLHGSAVVRVR